MQQLLHFTPGPSELYFTVAEHLRRALREGVGSVSHRSSAFENIYKESSVLLRELLAVPDSFHIVFTSSANEIWERILQNCVVHKSYHLVNGAFSEKFYDFALDLQLDAEAQKLPSGKGFDLREVEVPLGTELLALTQNETSTGVSQPFEGLAALRQKHPDMLIALDAVSGLPYAHIPFEHIDTVYFSVQKGFGMPAGLGIWIFNDRCLAKAEAKLAQGKSIGTYHSLPSLMSKAKKFQTPETPNVMGIYLLGGVCNDMLVRGIDVLRRETDYKATLLYHHLEQDKKFKPAVAEAKFRSKTVIVADVLEGKAQDYIEKLKAQGLLIGSGYGEAKSTQIRIANFPAHSREATERLVDLLLPI
ncbi:MAG: aminotransferase class V-fold PLP-dependent enzyme [Bernardetiaceae bacterium]|nr:aminotransferase class V-fold PLP-dependent enzyme [Bernardetiaceae bacterium]